MRSSGAYRRWTQLAVLQSKAGDYKHRPSPQSIGRTIRMNKRKDNMNKVLISISVLMVTAGVVLFLWGFALNNVLHGTEQEKPQERVTPVRTLEVAEPNGSMVTVYDLQPAINVQK